MAELTTGRRDYAFTCLDQRCAIVRLDAAASLPEWASGVFLSITRTPHELSIICDAQSVPSGVTRQGPFACLQIAGPLDFNAVGIVAEISRLIADQQISLLTVSTYDTDYFFVRESDVPRVIERLRANGHTVSMPVPD